jgi:multiple sugar transport system substrate-binding protein
VVKSKVQHLIRLVAYLSTLSLLLAACGGEVSTPTIAPSLATTPPQGQATTAPTAAMTAPPATTGASADAGNIVWISTQFTPVEESERLRTSILKDFKGTVEYVPQDPGPFNDRLMAEHQTGKVTISLIGGLHGDFPPLIQAGAVEDLSALAARLTDRGIPEAFMNLGKMGTDKQYYIPWMQATYILAASKQALPYLPAGADVNKLTYDQLKEWAANIQKQTGERRFGLPGGPKGLIHRLFQGYLYPAYTGHNIVDFRSPEAAQMWAYVKDLWQYTNPQSTSYEFMQEPLLSGEVWLTIDHTARLINAVKERPDDFVLAPAPTGPKGQAFMPVIAGLGIPTGAPNRAGAEALIEYLTQPSTQITTLRENAFFPVVKADTPSDLDKGTSMEAAAVAAQSAASNALPALLPVGLGAKGGEYNKVFTDSFQRIVLKNEDIQTVLDDETKILQGILNDTKAACWAPDPPSTGPCQVK